MTATTDTIREAVAMALVDASPRAGYPPGSHTRSNGVSVAVAYDLADAAIAAHLAALEAHGFVVVPRHAKSPAEIMACHASVAAAIKAGA